jgi:hypothetical protein
LKGQALGILHAGQIEPADEGGDRFAVAIGQRHHGVNGNSPGVLGWSPVKPALTVNIAIRQKSPSTRNHLPEHPDTGVPAQSEELSRRILVVAEFGIVPRPQAVSPRLLLIAPALPSLHRRGGMDIAVANVVAELRQRGWFVDMPLIVESEHSPGDAALEAPTALYVPSAIRRRRY